MGVSKRDGGGVALALVPPPPRASTTTRFFLRGQASSCRRLDDDVDDIIHERFLEDCDIRRHDFEEKEEIHFLLLFSARRGRPLFFWWCFVGGDSRSSMRDDAVQSDERDYLCDDGCVTRSFCLQKNEDATKTCLKQCTRAKSPSSLSSKDYEETTTSSPKSSPKSVSFKRRERERETKALPKRRVKNLSLSLSPLEKKTKEKKQKRQNLNVSLFETLNSHIDEGTNEQERRDIFFVWTIIIFGQRAFLCVLLDLREHTTNTGRIKRHHAL